MLIRTLFFFNFIYFSSHRLNFSKWITKITSKLILLVLEQVIMFLSDGLPTIGGDPVKVIAEENKILKNKVAVFTYAIGQCK